MKKPFVETLTSSEATALASIAQRRVLPKGAEVFCQGDEPEALYVVERGSIKVTRSSGTGRDLITEVLFPGDVCGGLCAMDCRPLPVGAICLEESEILRLPREEFQLLARRHPGLLLKAIESCRDKIKDQREMMVGMAVERAEQRAARGLMMLARALVEEGAPHPRMRMVLNRQEFSELIGTTVETAIRVLSQFRKQGLIQEEDGHIILRDLDGLKDLAESGC